jgi:hypothetical protein
LHPDVRPVSPLPDGSIRNGDVGVLNAVMTMGVIGAALIYAPLVALFAATWILYAVMTWGRS